MICAVGWSRRIRGETSHSLSSPYAYTNGYLIVLYLCSLVINELTRNIEDEVLWHMLLANDIVVVDD